MHTINFQTCLQSPGSTQQRGRFLRTSADISLCGPDGTAHVLRDYLEGANLLWGSVSVPVEKGTQIALWVAEGRVLSFNSESGLLLKQGEATYLFPAPPRSLRVDAQGRIGLWQPLSWQYVADDGGVTLAAKAPSESLVEFVWLGADGDLLRSAERQMSGEQGALRGIRSWAVEGCWGNLEGLGGFLQFWALGSIYNSRFGAWGRFPSAQTAYSLYKIASVLAKGTGNTLYTSLMVEFAYTALLSLKEDGRWENGEWLEAMETHTRLQIDGSLLLLEAYEQFGDPALLEGAERAAGFVLRAKEKLRGGGWWFLHDTLELDESLFRGYFRSYLAHSAFGKSSANTLTLNTHVSALVLLHRLADATQKSVYMEAYSKGLRALKTALASVAGRLPHLAAERLMELSLEDRPATLPRRAVRSLVRGKVRSRLGYIQRRWPRFVTPGGYLWRDMTLPTLGYWYHLVNLYDLLVLYRLDPQPWLRSIIDKALEYTLRSNIVSYMLAQRHPVAPQWLQILHAYSKIDERLDKSLLAQELTRFQEHGYGIPPELAE